jgi:hypothetical protein
VRFDELYERYCDGVLSEAERVEFLALLEDPAQRAHLAQAASFEAAVSEELRLSGAPADARKASSRAWPGVGTRGIPVHDSEDETRLLGKIGFAAAALVLIILVLVFVTSPRDEIRPTAIHARVETPPPRELPPPSPVEAPRGPPDPPPAPKPAAPEVPLRPRSFEPAPPRPEAPAPAKKPEPVQPTPPKPEETTRESVTFVATIERTAGEVSLGGEAGESGKGIASGRTLATGRNGYASIRYPDGSRIELGGETTLARIVEGPGGKSAQLEQGILMVDAAKQPAGRPLAISTAQAESQVVGTQFVLQAAPTFTRLDVREGRVKFTRLPQGVSSVMVSAGHYAVAGPTGEPAAKPSVGSWKAPPGGLQLWLRADAGVKLNGATVSLWSDQSASGNDAAQDKPGLQPMLLANAAAGRPSLRFDGVDDFFVLPNGFSDFRAGLTAFVVVRPAPGGAWSRFIDLDVGPACDNIVFGRKDAPDKLGFWVYSNSQTKGKVEAPGAVLPDQIQSFCALMAPIGRVTLFKNGGAVAAGDTSAPRMVLRKPNTLGKSNSGGGDPAFKGELFEILLYNRALSDAERAFIDTYLYAKYFDSTTPPALLRPADK